MFKAILYSLLSILLLSSCSVYKSFDQTAVYENVGPFLYYYEGIQNRLYGNPVESIRNLEKSLLLNQNNSAVYYELALSYASLNEANSAIKNLEEALKIEPTNIYYRNFLGVLYMNQRMFAEALDNQLYMVNTDSTNMSYRFQLALIYSNLSQFDKALENLNYIESSYGYLPNVSETKTKIFLQINKTDKAKEEINALINLFPDNPVYYLYESDLLFREGKDSLGFAKIHFAIDINPDLPISYIELFQRQAESGMIKQSVKTLKSIFENDNLSASEKSNLFYPVLFEQSYYSSQGIELDSIINIGIEKHPNSISVNEIAFEHFLRRNSFNAARTSLYKLYELDPDNPSRLDKIITFDYSLQQHEQALLSISNGISKFPKYYIFYVYKALIEDESGKPLSAIKTLEKGIENVTDKDHLSELYGTIGDLYYKIGNTKETFKAYDKSLENKEDNARVLNNYSYYLSINKKHLSKALEMSTKATELEPNNSTYIDTKGWVLFQMERYDEARDVLRNAIAKDGSNSAVINEHYGDALYKSGNKDNAYIYWLKAKELGENSPKLEEKLRTKTYVP